MHKTKLLEITEADGIAFWCVLSSCVLSSNNTNNTIFIIKNTKLYAPVVKKRIIVNYNVIINIKNFYDQAIDSDINR